MSNIGDILRVLILKIAVHKLSLTLAQRSWKNVTVTCVILV